jgi:lipopolysaccharide heptosyltransferase I
MTNDESNTNDECSNVQNGEHSGRLSHSSFDHSNLNRHSNFVIRHSLDRILIIKPSSLGDVATALPLLCDLRRAYPHATIDWLVAPPFAPLVQNHDALNNVILFDRKQLAPWWRSPAAFKKFRALNRRLKSARYDCVIDAQGLLRSGYFSRITSAKIRIGFADAREGGSLFYTHKVPIRRREAMAVVRMRALLDPLGIPHDHPPDYRVPLNPLAQEKAAALIPENAIGFIPGSRGAGKRWPAEGFAALIAQLAESHPIVLFGSPDEKSLCDQILAQSGATGHARINLAGKTSIAEMTACLARCQLIIGNDTGPLHVAVALGKTVIGLYGKTNPQSVGPYGQLDNVVRFNPNESWITTSRDVLTRAGMLLAPADPGIVSRA